MAITKIWSVKSRLDTSLNYIGNPEKTTIKPDIDAVEGVAKYIVNKDKTEKCMYVRSYGCTVEDAYEEMLETQKFFKKDERKGRVLAYHLVQSFKDFETTPEVAHKCGLELVERLFSDKYEVVIATHLDQDHLHNHILINSVSYLDGMKYRNNFKDYFHDIRGVSDAICRENCLSVIDKPKHRGMHYAEIKALREGKPTIRGSVRKELDDIISISYTMKDFWRILEKRGFVICRRRPKYQYTSFIPPNGKKQIRLDKLGPEYTEEAIMERITTARNGIRTAAPSELPKRKVYKYNGDLKSLKPKKLKGFVALYFHYMYFFKIIRRKETPQRVSFFLREELIKFDRYQKQFKFLYKNNIEDGTQLSALQKSKEDKINDLVNERKALYASRTDENESEIKDKANEINKELQALRVDVRMCKSIAVDSYKIARKSQEVKNLLKQAEMEMKANEHKRRGR